MEEAALVEYASARGRGCRQAMPWFRKREIRCQYTSTFVHALLYLCQYSFVCHHVSAHDEKRTRTFELLEARSGEMAMEQLLLEARIRLQYDRQYL